MHISKSGLLAPKESRWRNATRGGFFGGAPLLLPLRVVVGPLKQC